MTGAKKFSKMVCTWTNDNTRGFKMYEVDGSTETLSMEATYTRKGTSNAGESKSLTDKVDAATKSASDAIKKALPTK